MKVVINKCYGGFGLSPEAILRLYELGGQVELTPIKEYFGKELTEYSKSLREWKEYMSFSEAKEVPMFFTIFTPDDQFVISHREVVRDDPKLIQVIEEMGSEKASGNCAALAIVEIPDGTSYVIEEYDGNEHIAESHQTWY